MHVCFLSEIRKFAHESFRIEFHIGYAMCNKLALNLFELAKFNKKQKLGETHEKEDGPIPKEINTTIFYVV